MIAGIAFGTLVGVISWAYGECWAAEHPRSTTLWRLISERFDK